MTLDNNNTHYQHDHINFGTIFKLAAWLVGLSILIHLFLWGYTAYLATKVNSADNDIKASRQFIRNLPRPVLQINPTLERIRWEKGQQELLSRFSVGDKRLRIPLSLAMKLYVQNQAKSPSPSGNSP